MRINQLLVTLLTAGAAASTFAAEPGTTGQSAGATALRYENTRNQAYCEVFLVRKPTDPTQIDADVYNSTRLNDCPRDKFKALDPEALAKEHGVVRAIVNQRRYWMQDSYTFFKAGSKVSFGGIEMDWVALLRVPPGLGANAQAKPYQMAQIARDTEKRYLKGRPVFELISPDGTNWIMQSAIDQPLRLDSFAGIANVMKLPEGWSFRYRILNRDLVMRSNGSAQILQDDMMNVYEGCVANVCRDE
jgi:hypothetical protein